MNTISKIDKQDMKFVSLYCKYPHMIFISSKPHVDKIIIIGTSYFVVR